MIEGVDPSMYPDADLGSDRDEREPKPCCKRVRFESGRYGFCIKPAGHRDDCQALSLTELPPAFEVLDPKRKPRWGL